MKKERLDVLMVRRNLAESRETAKALIMSMDRRKIRRARPLRRQYRLRSGEAPLNMSAGEGLSWKRP